MVQLNKKARTGKVKVINLLEIRIHAFLGNPIIKKEDVEACCCYNSGMTDHLCAIYCLYMTACNMSPGEVHRPAPQERLLGFQGGASLTRFAQPGWMPDVLPPPQCGYNAGRASIWLWCQHLCSITSDIPRIIETIEVTCPFYTFIFKMRKLNVENAGCSRGRSCLSHIGCLPRDKNGPFCWGPQILHRSFRVWDSYLIGLKRPQTWWPQSAGSACFSNSLPMGSFFRPTYSLWRRSYGASQPHWGRKAHPEDVLPQ